MTRYVDVDERLAEQKRLVHESQMREWFADVDEFPGEGFCYFIGGDEGPIKIGCSRQPNRRLYELNRDTPEKLKLLASVRGGREREGYYHRLFEDHCQGGEWFERAPEILEEIERLRP